MRGWRFVEGEELGMEVQNFRVCTIQVQVRVRAGPGWNM